MMMTRNRHVEKGFTLIELLVVIAILGILAGLLIPAVSDGNFKARVTTCTNNICRCRLELVGATAFGRLPHVDLPGCLASPHPFEDAVAIQNGRLDCFDPPHPL